MPKLSIIVPCYQNEFNIPVTSMELIKNEENFPSELSFEYIMVDDGSKDNTLGELKKFKALYPDKVKIVKLSGNFGAVNATLSGMSQATGDCNVILAADLQDPPELIIKMYEYWQKGIKLIVANRDKRQDSLFIQIFARTYQMLIRKFAIKNLPKGGFDLCLFDKDLREKILLMNEKNTNIGYLMLLLKYDFVSIPYTRRKREIGRSMWSFNKRIQFFIDSFVSFSYFPLRLISITGIFLGFIALIYAVFVVFGKLFGHINVEGWTTLMLVFLLVSAFQMISLGIIGEYLWRTLETNRKRPNYVIDEII